MRTKIKACFSIILHGVFASLLVSEANAHEIVKVTKVDKPPVIDGVLDDAAWQKASLFTNFKTMHPEPGLPPSEKTEVRLVYDQEKIYVGLRCFDSEPDKIKAGNAKRDNPGSDDWIAFCLDTFNDELGAHAFLVNPLGVQADGLLNADGSPSLTLNMEWASAGRPTREGYSAEIAISFKNLPFQWQEKVEMGFKVARFISRKSEEVDFPEILPDRGPHLAQFQKIELSGIARSALPGTLPIVDVNERYLQKMQLSLKHDTNTLDGRCRAWGDAAVIDYLLFPKHEFKASDQVFHFKKNPKEKLVTSLFQAFEYSQGKRIVNFERFLRRTETAAFIVILQDTVIYEKYFNGYHRESIVTSFSVAKSFASTLIGIAIDEKLIAEVQDPITQYLPELKKRDERFARITIRDLLLMSAGIRYEEDSPYRDDEITYYDPDLRQAALRQTEIVDAPGKYFLYNNYHPLLIGMILERVSGKTVSEYLQEKLWQPLGMELSGSWSTDSEKHGFEKMESGINARAIDFAKFARLFLKNGRWGAKQIVSSQWVEQATQPEEKASGYYPAGRFFHSEDGYYKYFWWGRKRSNGKSDFFALGNKGQYLYISPQKNLIIVRNGIEYGISSMSWARLFYEFASSL